VKSQVRLPGDIIFRSRLHQNLDPVDRDSESRRSISCGILLFFSTDGLRCQPHWSVHSLNGSITLDGRTDLFTPWVTPSLWMVVQIWSGRSVLREVPRLLTTPGQTWWIPYRTNFIRKDSGCWCNLNPKITPFGSRTRDFTVVGRYNYRYAVKVSITLDESLHIVRPSRVMEWPKGWTDLYDHQEWWSHSRSGQTNEADSRMKNAAWNASTRHGVAVHRIKILM